MTIQTVNIGAAPNDGTGDSLRTGIDKVNDNFTDNDNAAAHLLLGTVSQSGGTPTGSIIERGSNANGEYVKYADGTLICTFERSGMGFDLAGTNYYLWTYPAAFIAPPLAICFPRRLANDTLDINVRGGTFNATTANFAHNQSNIFATNFAMQATGRWF